MLRKTRKHEKSPAGRKQRKSESAVLTVEEAAALLRIGRAAAYAAVKSKRIPSLRFGRKIVVPMGQLRKLLGETAA
jgi:excisionase family DNA binding protein